MSTGTSREVVPDLNGRPLHVGAQVEAWLDGVKYTGTITDITVQLPGCGNHRHVRVDPGGGKADRWTFSDSVAVLACTRAGDGDEQACAHGETRSPAYHGHCTHASCPNYLESCPIHRTPKAST